MFTAVDMFQGPFPPPAGKHMPTLPIYPQIMSWPQFKAQAISNIVHCYAHLPARQQTARFEAWVDAYFEHTVGIKHFEYQRGVGITPEDTTGLARRFLQENLGRVELSDFSAQEVKAVKCEILRAPHLHWLAEILGAISPRIPLYPEPVDRLEYMREVCLELDRFHLSNKQKQLTFQRWMSQFEEVQVDRSEFELARGRQAIGKISLA